MSWDHAKAVSWTQWKARANTAANGVTVGAGVLVAARTEGVEHEALAEAEVRVWKVVLVLARGHHLRRALAIVLARPHGPGPVHSHHIAHVVGASRLTASIVVCAIIHVVEAFLRIGWRRDYCLVRARTVVGTQG